MLDKQVGSFGDKMTEKERIWKLVRETVIGLAIIAFIAGFFVGLIVGLAN